MFVSSIIPIKWSSDGWDPKIRDSNRRLIDVIQWNHDRGHHVVYVDMYSEFNQSADSSDYASGDAVHPSDIGYIKMMEKWLEFIIRFH